MSLHKIDIAPEKIGISGKGNILQSTVKIDSLERVFQLEKIIYNHEPFSVLGISEDDEKVVIFTESMETRTKRKQIFTFDVKRSKNMRESYFTITNKSLYDLKTFGLAIGLFGDRLKYDERQACLETLNKPKDVSEILESFLDFTYDCHRVQAEKLGALLPNFSLWKLDYIEKNGIANIIQSVLNTESKVFTLSENDVIILEEALQEA